MGEGSRQRVAIGPSIEEIVHVSTVSFAAELIDLIFNVCDDCKLTGRGDSLKTTFDDIAYFRMDNLSARETASREAGRWCNQLRY